MNQAADLLEAYRQTSFLVETPGETICIRIGQVEAALENLLESEGARQWAYVTAWNPGSIPLSDNENGIRERELEREVRQAGYAFFRGRGVGADRQWPPEPSLLILGISPDGAVQLGRKYGQVAIVAGQRGEHARLIHC